MPLVFAMNEASEADLEYEDVPFVSYEYPNRYRNRVRPGDRFVYYRGRKRRGGGRQPQVYLGTGIVGQVRPSRRAGRLVCEVLDGRPFDSAVFFKTDEGAPLEPEGRRRGYYQEGVRAISEGTYSEILARAPLSASSDVASAGLSGGGMYADSETGRALEEYSREVISRHLREHHAATMVEELPANNPGFDLRSDVSSAEFVEVKATQAPIARFLLSEGERIFSVDNADSYLMCVVYGIDLEDPSHVGIAEHWGPIEATSLAPVQWAGQLPLQLR